MKVKFIRMSGTEWLVKREDNVTIANITHNPIYLLQSRPSWIINIRREVLTKCKTLKEAKEAVKNHFQEV